MQQAYICLVHIFRQNLMSTQPCSFQAKYTRSFKYFQANLTSTQGYSLVAVSWQICCILRQNLTCTHCYSLVHIFRQILISTQGYNSLVHIFRKFDKYTWLKPCCSLWQICCSFRQNLICKQDYGLVAF